MSTFSGIEETECVHFQESDDIPTTYSAPYAEYIPYACGTHSVALRNPFRTHTEYEVDVVFLKIVHTGSCIPVIVYTGYLLFLKVYTLRVLYS